MLSVSFNGVAWHGRQVVLGTYMKRLVAGQITILCRPGARKQLRSGARGQIENRNYWRYRRQSGSAPALPGQEDMHIMPYDAWRIFFDDGSCGVRQKHSDR